MHVHAPAAAAHTSTPRPIIRLQCTCPPRAGKQPQISITFSCSDDGQQPQQSDRKDEPAGKRVEVASRCP
eukprot:1082-Chlamydomonas_euryale.AAC.4